MFGALCLMTQNPGHQECWSAFIWWTKVEKIKWLENIISEDFLSLIGEKKRLLNNTMRRKVTWIRHILKRNYLLYGDTEVLMMEVNGMGRRTK